MQARFKGALPQAMTNTLKPVKRESIGAYGVIGRGPEHVRPIILRVHRDALYFRVKGQREEYRMPLEIAFRHAVCFDILPADLDPPPPLEHVADADGRRKWKTSKATAAGQMELFFETPDTFTEPQITHAAQEAIATA